MFDVQLVHVTPQPIFARLETLNDRMAGFVEMLGGVPIRRIVAAPDVSARQAKTQVYPLGSDRQTFLAAFRSARLNRLDLTYVLA